MTPRIRSLTCHFASLAAALSLPLISLSAQDVAPPPDTEGMEVLTRGVIHEAFAEVVSDPKPSLVVSKRPPEAIEEVPPELKPDDEATIWISGYWVWDDERDDFFWQSGVWRVVPPGMRWVAGYWHEVPGGWGWVSGFWVSTETDEIRYYDAPPASLEAGPSSPSPGDNFFWATGSWTYVDTGYRWQPGYWSAYQDNWVWISARYVWTPAGCVYLPGRWDYRLTRRGCLFAPVYFTQPIYLRTNYVYRPWYALNTSNLFVHLWVRPNYGHFYFGNYYGSNWNNWGVTPWCQYRPYRNCYDPVLTQLQCHYRQSGVNYISRLDGWHNHYAKNVSHRPPGTWNEQIKIVNQTNSKQISLAVNLQDAARRNDLSVKFAHLDGNMHKQAIDRAKESRDLRQHRISVEKQAGLSPDLVKRNLEKRGGDQSGSNVGKGHGDQPSAKPDLGQRPRVNDQARLKLPAAHVSDIVKEKEKVAPPKPKQTPPWAELPEINKRRGEGRVPTPRREPTGVIPQPKVELPDSRPKVEVPKAKVERRGGEPRNRGPQNKIENPLPVTPKLDIPKVEIPQRQPKVEVPQRQPKVEIPESKRRIDNPQPKLGNPAPRGETRERPQIKLDIPKPAVKLEAAPRHQPSPRMETPRNEPRRGGDKPPRGGRNKPE
jgi:WXXGXW repeat (2 copies)